MRHFFAASCFMLSMTGCQVVAKDPAFSRALTPEDVALNAACPVTSTSYLQQARARGSLTVVGVGSSSMEGVGASSPRFDFVSRLEAALKEALPGVTVRVVNAGRGGENLLQMKARLPRDVYTTLPDLVILQTGMNDAIQNRDPDVYRRDLQSALNDLQSRGFTVILMGNQYAGQTGPAATPLTAQLDQVNNVEAARRRITVIDRFKLFRTLQEQGIDVAGTYFRPDALHGNDEGYRLVAACALRVMFGLP